MKTLGCERSLELFAPATWTAHTVSASCDAVYPGLRPTGSWLLHPDGELRGLDPDGEGWRDRDSAEPIDLDGRKFVLAYGSNAATAKLLTREDKEGFFFGEPVIALRAAVFGWAAVWCRGRRQRDKSVVATLAPVPDRVEVHPVLALTEAQLSAMDEWENVGDSLYVRKKLKAKMQWESGRWADDADVEFYEGFKEQRRAFMPDGNPIPLADCHHDRADEIVPGRR